MDRDMDVQKPQYSLEELRGFIMSSRERSVVIDRFNEYLMRGAHPTAEMQERYAEAIQISGSQSHGPPIFNESIHQQPRFYGPNRSGQFQYGHQDGAQVQATNPTQGWDATLKVGTLLISAGMLYLQYTDRQQDRESKSQDKARETNWKIFEKASQAAEFIAKRWT